MLHVRQSGPREHATRGSVVFVHGFPFDSTLWNPQLADLPPGWRGLAPDLRGFGQSVLRAEELPGEEAGAGVARDGEPVLTMARLADDVAEVIREECDGPAVVCGLSMGGYVTFELLRRHPRLIRAAILADTRAAGDSDDARENRRRMAGTVRESGTRPIANAMIPDLLTAATRENAPGVVDHVRRMILDTPPLTIIAALAGMATRHDATGDLPDIALPTLVIVGESDAITPPDGARAMAGAIPHASLTVVPDAGHLSGLENPETFNAAIAAFLEGL